MTDNLCESCDHWKVHWDMHSECKVKVVQQDTYRSVKLGCPKYDCINKKEGKTE